MIKKFSTVRWILITLVVLLAPMMMPQPVLANATLVFSPASGEVSLGGIWKTSVLLNSDGAVNSVDTTVVFPAGNLEATTVDFSGGIFGLSLPGSGAIDNTNGTVRIIQASPSPYSGSGGKIATISFKTKALGPADLHFGTSKVIAQDGQGTNVYSGGGTASVNVVTASTSTTTTQSTTTTTSVTRTPVISSSSHPNQDAWYKSRSIAYSWTTTGTGYNFTVDQNPTTDLPNTVVGTAASSSVSVTSDGLWYAHVKAQGPNGWSQTANFKFQIDTTAPAAFTATTDPSGDVTVLPTINFEAKDDGSGIDHYEVQFDGGAWTRQNSGFKSPSLDSGSHTVLVRAFDKAGNTTDSQTTFNLRQLQAPVITSPENKQLLMLGEQLKVTGKAAPNVEVDVYINNKKVETITSDSNGYFTTSQPLLLFAGAYQIVARAINKDGIASAPSSPVTLTIDARAVKLFGNVWPGWVVLVGVIVIIAMLMVGLGILAYMLWHKTSAWATRLQGLDDSVARDLALLEAHVDSSIDTSLGAMAPEATAIKSALNSEIATVKKDVDTMAHTTPNVRVKPPQPGNFDKIKAFIKRVTPHVSFGPASTTAVTPDPSVAGGVAAPVAAAQPAITMPAAPPPAFTSEAIQNPQTLITNNVQNQNTQNDDNINSGQTSTPPVAENTPAAPTPVTEPAPATQTVDDQQQATDKQPGPSTDGQATVLSAPTTAFPVSTMTNSFAAPQPTTPESPEPAVGGDEQSTPSNLSSADQSGSAPTVAAQPTPAPEPTAETLAGTAPAATSTSEASNAAAPAGTASPILASDVKPEVPAAPAAETQAQPAQEVSNNSEPKPTTTAGTEATNVEATTPTAPSTLTSPTTPSEAPAVPVSTGPKTENPTTTTPAKSDVQPATSAPSTSALDAVKQAEKGTKS